ncbi:Prolyl 4-hydroxylase subunit alpha-2 [Orchesella cincta]|uniref:procollagen-proline 4-dioxygenase n=1 Tax=Orchesella cincta TaxID=48709 RepID=A0A1D2N7M0_ORCCI|nr:Prolyl 4-hydroxylase subunit alpha-2 [Orchesella cincta]
MEKVAVLTLLSLLQLSSVIQCEVFTSQSDLESLIYLRREVKSAIDEYIQKEESRLEYLKERLKSSRGLSSGDESDATNPINAFLLVKGLSLDLAEIVAVTGDRDSFKEFARRMEELNEATTFPDNEDISGAALGLIRLQDTYQLDTKSIANGALGDSCCAPELSDFRLLPVDDCFELGRQSYLSKDYDYAIQWFTEALFRYPSTEVEDSIANVSMLLPHGEEVLISTDLEFESSSKVSKSKILDYLSWAKDIKKTLEIGKDFLAKLTGLEMDAFVDQVARAVSGGDQEETKQKRVALKSNNLFFKDRDTLEARYKSLCRGETKSNSSINPMLKCYFSSRGNNPYYLIGPIKEEILNLSPLIKIFRNIIHDEEIEKIKELAKPRLETAMVVNVFTGSNEKSQTRVSKTAWLVDEDDPIVSKINQRVGFVTGLSMETAELLQIANYGIGGMYLPHYDYAQPGQTASFVTNTDGNRIATLLFYMSDVEKGGATVFPKLNLSVWPEKGSAAFWYNLKKNGDGDSGTQHAACPVLLGTKFVSNKWIHERGQEFRRRCSLKPNE